MENWVKRELLRLSLSIAVWTSSIVGAGILLNIELGKPFIVAVSVASGILYVGTQIFLQIRAKGEKGASVWEATRHPWGGTYSPLQGYVNVLVLILAFWVFALVIHPSWTLALAAKQGYFTAVIAHFLTLLAVNRFDRDFPDQDTTWRQRRLGF